jgi:hypothetical protein
MTLPPAPAIESGDPAPVSVDPRGGEGLWHLAMCGRCVPDLAEPFRDEIARDDWAVGHAATLGHGVVLREEDATGRAQHGSALITFSPHVNPSSPWWWMCALPTSATLSGWADTGQLALAARRKRLRRLEAAENARALPDGTDPSEPTGTDPAAAPEHSGAVRR